MDLNHDGDTIDPEDAFGFNRNPGQYGMLLLSRHPIQKEKIRTFQNFLWRDLPGNLMPSAHYGDAAMRLRLTSKSHWDDANNHPIQIISRHYIFQRKRGRTSGIIICRGYGNLLDQMLTQRTSSVYFAPFAVKNSPQSFSRFFNT